MCLVLFFLQFQSLNLKLILRKILLRFDQLISKKLVLVVDLLLLQKSMSITVFTWSRSISLDWDSTTSFSTTCFF
eukprot:UN06448